MLWVSSPASFFQMHAVEVGQPPVSVSLQERPKSMVLHLDEAKIV